AAGADEPSGLLVGGEVAPPARRAVDQRQRLRHHVARRRLLLADRRLVGLLELVLRGVQVGAHRPVDADEPHRTLFPPSLFRASSLICIPPDARLRRNSASAESGRSSTYSDITRGEANSVSSVSHRSDLKNGSSRLPIAA